MSELYCCLGCPAFEPGRQNLIFLYCNPDVIFEPEEWVVSVEFHGHLVGSTRWIKDVRHFENWLTYERVPEMILDQGHKLPIDPSLKEKNGPEFRRQCIFSTAKIVVSPISVQETGLVVEVDVPKEMLPTFRGRAVQVNYYLTVTMEKSDVQKRLHFPVPMNGQGYDKPTVLVQSGGIVAYAPTTIPEETYLESSFLEVTSDERETEGSLHGSHHSSHSSHVKSPVSEKSINIHPPVVYSVRDESHVCNVSLPRGGLIAGDHEAFDVNFADQAQPCYAIKASLRMIESQFRADDATPITVQEKEVWGDYRLTTDVEYLRMLMYIPDESFCTFHCACAMVQYKLLLEFFLAPDSTVEPLSFTIDLEVVTQVNVRRLRHPMQIGETGTPAMDRKAQYLSMLHTCLEARNSRIPYIDLENTL